MARVVVLGSGERAQEVARNLAAIGHEVTVEVDELVLPTSSGIEVVLRLAEPFLVERTSHPRVQRDRDGSAEARGRPDHSLARAATDGHVSSAVNRRTQRYPPGRQIQLDQGWVGEIKEGCVVLSVVHEDGAEVIIGFLGPGDFLLPHPADSCHVLPAAVTDVRLEVSPWTEEFDGKLYALALGARVLRAEAWAAAQAHPHIEQRVFGTLNLLAEQFGTSAGSGRLVGVRITHSQLAAVTGATRPTITRVLAHLKRKGLVKTVGSGSRQMLQLLSGGALGAAWSVATGLVEVNSHFVVDYLLCAGCPV
jgi:CRP-like cAMP-binding protein